MATYKKIFTSILIITVMLSLTGLIYYFYSIYGTDFIYQSGVFWQFIKIFLILLAISLIFSTLITLATKEQVDQYNWLTGKKKKVIYHNQEEYDNEKN